MDIGVYIWFVIEWYIDLSTTGDAVDVFTEVLSAATLDAEVNPNHAGDMRVLYSIRIPSRNFNGRWIFLFGPGIFLGAMFVLGRGRLKRPFL